MSKTIISKTVTPKIISKTVMPKIISKTVMPKIISKTVMPKIISKTVMPKIISKKYHKYLPSFISTIGIVLAMTTILISGAAGAEIAGVITLEEAIEKALSTSDRIHVIEEEHNRSNAEARKVDAFTGIRLDSSMQYYEMGTSTEDTPFFSSPDRQISAGVTASRLLWAGGRIPGSRALKEHLMILAELEENSLKRDLARDVSTAFRAVLYRQARLNVLEDRMRQRKDELSDATDLFEAGMVTNLDVREARLNLHVAQDDLRSGESEFHTGLVDFNLVLGESADQDKALFIPRGSLLRPRGLAELLHQLEILYQKGRQLDIQTAGEVVNISEKKLNIARGELLPEIALVAGAEYGGESSSELKTSWNAGAQLT